MVWLICCTPKKAHVGTTEWCIVMMMLWLICWDVDKDTPGISTHWDKWIQTHQNLAHTGTQQCTILTILWLNCCTPKKAQIGTQWCIVLMMLWPICCSQDKSTHPKKAHMGTALQCYTTLHWWCCDGLAVMWTGMHQNNTIVDLMQTADNAVGDLMYQTGQKLTFMWLTQQYLQWMSQQTNKRSSRSGERIFFSRVNFLCWVLLWYPFHPHVTTVARKRPQSFCQKCGWQVTAKHTGTVHAWCCMTWRFKLVHGCMM